ncbi:MAG TPA: glycosyltransferase family 39 protein [Thermoanaerobaculia bacterium]|nr:glycosyltransferase family 39 protein [Thermoanaerobaculia bacterium]
MRSKALLVLALIALPLLRIASTFGVFSQTYDEPLHIASGFQWLTTNRYDLDAEHPPLARVILALDSALSGVKTGGDDALSIGNALLERDDHYRRNLFGARAGNLLFFLLGAAIVGLWTRRLFGDGAALVSLALFGALPPILGHAGLATTDMAAAATTATALFLLARWLDAPSWPNALLVAAGCGIGLLSKFSFLVFFPAAAAMLVIARVASRTAPRVLRQRIPQIAAGVLVAFVMFWAGYKFSLGLLNDARLQEFAPALPPHAAAEYATKPGYDWVRLDLLERYYRYSEDAAKRVGHGVDFVDWAKAAGYPSPMAGRHGNTMIGTPPLPPPSLTDRLLEPMRSAWQSIAIHHPIPAPIFFAGLELVQRHSSAGHAGFLLGTYRDHGWWYYFPVVLFFKTPLAFLILAVIGVVLMIRSRNAEAIGVVLAPAAMLLPTLTTGINIGVRHVLPLYPLLTICAAYAVMALWRRRRVVVIVLLAWYFLATALAHPDYMSYFNEAAGGHPERIAVDSNLDWGQDLLRLAEVVRREHIDHLYLAYFGSADWRCLVPAAEELPQFKSVHGWVAVSENELTFGWPTNRRDAYAWLRAYEPVVRVGKSIRLYRIP